MSEPLIPTEYASFLGSLKERIRTARVRAALSVNRELVMLYWEIGREILARQATEGWGAKVIDRLAADLRAEFPDMKGLSRSNLLYMRSFAEAWPDDQIVQQLAGQLPWFHNVILFTRLKDSSEREWYARKTVENGWSRAILEAQIETEAHKRQGKAITNFERTLPAPQSELAQQVLKDPYTFDFLTLHDDAVERDLERGLLAHLKEFMVELGVGFAFVGRQVHLEVEGRDFYIDLLFYHLQLRCFVVIDLKMGEFQPEYAGKLNFYLSAVDAQRRHPDDAPSIGILLCKGANQGLVVEYALKDMNKPLGVAQYQLAESLPEQLEGALPTVEQLEAELAKDLPKTKGMKKIKSTKTTRKKP
jgi:predicted nuclease of restriction endonuclease-like (RecB) superfamily